MNYMQVILKGLKKRRILIDRIIGVFRLLFLLMCILQVLIVAQLEKGCDEQNWWGNLFMFSFFYVLSNVLHEVVHAILFSLAGYRVKRIVIGVLYIDIVKKYIRIKNNRIFMAYCLCDKQEGASLIGGIVALYAGGVSCLVAGVTVGTICVREGVDNCIWVIFILAYISNFLINVVNPFSTDRKLICKMRGRLK